MPTYFCLCCLVKRDFRNRILAYKSCQSPTTSTVNFWVGKSSIETCHLPWKWCSVITIKFRLWSIGLLSCLNGVVVCFLVIFWTDFLTFFGLTVCLSKGASSNVQESNAGDQGTLIVTHINLRISQPSVESISLAVMPKEICLQQYLPTRSWVFRFSLLVVICHPPPNLNEPLLKRNWIKCHVKNVSFCSQLKAVQIDGLSKQTQFIPSLFAAFCFKNKLFSLFIFSIFYLSQMNFATSCPQSVQTKLRQEKISKYRKLRRKCRFLKTVSKMTRLFLFEINPYFLKASVLRCQNVLFGE